MISCLALRVLFLLVLAVGLANANVLGKSCTQDSECDGTLLCIFNKCAEPGGPEASCESPFLDNQCAGGLICLFNICSEKAGAGDACEVANECDSGLLCIFGKCAEPGGLEATCEGPATDNQCPGGLICLFKNALRRLEKEELMSGMMNVLIDCAVFLTSVLSKE